MVEPTVKVAFVITQTSPEESIRRLVHATGHIDEVLSPSALRTLIQLTSMAHRTGQEAGNSIMTFPTADLDRLEFLGFIALDSDSIAIELI